MSLENTNQPQFRSRPASESSSFYLDSLLRMGNVFELDFSFDAVTVDLEIKPFESNWVQYNPYKPQNPRKGLSVTSLDGGLSGNPDLYSLREYHKREGRLYRERDFNVPTPVFRACESLSPLLDLFRPHLGRTHFLRFETGGYFPPHRDGAGADETDTFRILVPLHGVCRNNFVFLYGGERITLEIGSVYFINTLVSHALFAFAPVTLLVCNVVLSRESVKIVKSSLMQR